MFILDYPIITIIYQYPVCGNLILCIIHPLTNDGVRIRYAQVASAKPYFFPTVAIT